MFNSIIFTYSYYWLFLIIPASIGIAYLYYKKTKPELLKYQKIILATLRASLIILLFLLLLKPFLNIISTIEQKSIIIILQDNTESLILTPDSNKIKKDYPKQFNKFLENIEKANNIQIETYLFSGNVEENKSLNFQGKKTNISKAITEVLQEYENLPLHSIYLISDGIYNEGINPIYTAEKTNVPINTILIGDTNIYPDIYIENVVYNKIAYLETEIPIKVYVNKKESGLKNTVIFLKDKKGTIIKREKIKIPSEIEWNIPVLREGFYHFIVEIPTLKNEINKANNIHHIYIKVIKDKINVSLIAGEAHPDIASFSRALKYDKRFNLRRFVKVKNKFIKNISEKDIIKTNVFILYNFPNSVEDKNLLTKIIERVKKGKAGLFLFVGTKTNLKDFPELTSFLPMFPVKYSNYFSEAMLYADEQLENTPLWTFDNEFKNWLATSPPILLNNSEWKLKANSTPLIRVKIKSIKTEYVAMAYSEINNVRSALFIGQNLWKLRLANYIFSQDFSYFDGFIKNILQWLAVNISKNKFFVETNKNFYLEYEPIYIYANLRDEALKPIPDANINVEVRKKDSEESYSYVLSPTGNGVYSYKIASLPAGEYKLFATAKKNGKTIATAQNNFIVAKSTIEALNLKANKTLLKQISIRSKGKFFSSLQEAEKHINSQSFPTILDYVEKNINLYEWLPYIILILIIASVEWFLRRYWGLM